MKHLNDEELIEHYYDGRRRQHSFGEDRDAGDAAQHIASCAECGANYTALQADLSDLAGFDPPFRGPAYGQQVWESIARSFPERPERRQFWMRADLWRGLAYAAAATVLLAATFYAGRIWEHSRAPVPTAKTPASAPAPKQQVVVVVMSDYLDRSERLLVELKHTDADDSDMLPPLHDEARKLLPANRICQREADRSDDPELERALNALDRLLTNLADQPGGLDLAAVMRLQKEMNADGLLFEVRVLRSRIPATEQARGTASKGGKI